MTQSRIIHQRFRQHRILKRSRKDSPLINLYDEDFGRKGREGGEREGGGEITTHVKNTQTWIRLMKYTKK